MEPIALCKIATEAVFSSEGGWRWSTGSEVPVVHRLLTRVWSWPFDLDRKSYWWAVLYRLELSSIKQLIFWPHLLFNWTCIVKSKVEFSGRGIMCSSFTWHMFKRKVLSLGWYFFMVYDLLNYYLIKWLVGIWSLLNMLVISFKYCSSFRKQQKDI